MTNQEIEFYNNGPETERFQWDNAWQRFETSDDLHVFGSLSADVKNFVQNHPYREDLEIVYASLEGNEVTTTILVPAPSSVRRSSRWSLAPGWSACS